MSPVYQARVILHLSWLTVWAAKKNAISSKIQGLYIVCRLILEIYMIETEIFHGYFFREIPPCCVNTAHPIFRIFQRLLQDGTELKKKNSGNFASHSTHPHILPDGWITELLGVWRERQRHVLVEKGKTIIVMEFKCKKKVLCKHTETSPTLSQFM